MGTPLIDIPTGWDPQAKQQQRVALADFSAAPWQGFEKSEHGPNNSSLFRPQAAVVVVAVRVPLGYPRQIKKSADAKHQRIFGGVPSGTRTHGLQIHNLAR